MFVVPVVCLLSAVFFYTQALQNAMGAKRWGALALIMGPFLWPMFNTHKRLLWLRAGRRGVACDVIQPGSLFA
ncbi:MAG: hypothetical protein JJU03_06225 [Idiomarina sp.]|nr:hypothetical protein [Idiomarina sp.]